MPQRKIYTYRIVARDPKSGAVVEASETAVWERIEQLAANARAFYGDENVELIECCNVEEIADEDMRRDWGLSPQRHLPPDVREATTSDRNS